MTTKPRTRRSFSLIEMMVTIAVGSAITGDAVSVLYLLLALERDSRGGLRRRAAMAELVGRFRDDVHGATDFRIVDMPAGGAGTLAIWELASAEDRVIQYRQTENDLRRTERAGDELVGQESFVLPDDAQIHVERSDALACPIVSLRVVPEDSPSGKAGMHPVRVDAVLGSDHRFAKAQEP